MYMTILLISSNVPYDSYEETLLDQIILQTAESLMLSKYK